MSGMSASLVIPQWGAPDAHALMEECDRMEAELGAWLAQRAARLGGRRDVAGKPCGRNRDLRPSLWRTLIHIWATSPEARARFSSDARGGLVSATSSMDGRTLMSLVEGLLEDSPLAGAGPAAA